MGVIGDVRQRRHQLRNIIFFLVFFSLWEGIPNLSHIIFQEDKINVGKKKGFPPFFSLVTQLLKK